MSLTTDDRREVATSISMPQEPVPKKQVPVAIVIRRGLLGCAAFGLVLTLWLTVLSALPQHRHQTSLQREFRAQLQQGVAAVNQPVPTGSPVALIEIPAIDLEEVVVEGTRSVELVRGPGHLRTSRLPNQPGVAVVLGRRLAYGGPFGRLDDLRGGDRLTVTTGQGVLSYSIAEVRTHSADDASAFVADGDALVLVSADPPGRSSGRIVVVARPDGVPFPAGARVAQTPVVAEELGLAGTPRAAVGLMVWGQLFVVASLGAFVLARRWRRWPAWMIASPIVVVCGWMVLEQLSLMLPAML
jgi:sortase A